MNDANAIAETRASIDDLPETSDIKYNDLESNDAPPQHVRGGSPSRSRASPTSSRLDPETQDAEQPPDDRKLPRQLSRMRPPGTAGLPEAWVPSRSQDVVLGLSKDAGSPDLYIAALTALIAEIKKTGAGQKRYELENGTRADPFPGDTVYVFPFTDEADLFEDSKIEVTVPGRRVEGSVVSISPGRLVLAVKEDLGAVLVRAVIVVDATALLEALKDKLGQIKRNELTINRMLADAVVGRADPPPDPSPIPTTPSKGVNLNPKQWEAYKKALGSTIAYIWGPPGCGKTVTLGEVARTAFDAEKRVLICSNTNKAVDQVLNRICYSLGKEHPAMKQGRIVRLGRIVDDKLKNYTDYVTVDGIAERLSQELAARRRAIEVEISRIDSRTDEARQILESFKIFARLTQTVETLEAETNALVQVGRQHKSDLQVTKARLEELQQELRTRQNSFFAIFKRSAATIRRDISSTHTRSDKLLRDIEVTNGRHSASRAKCEVAQQERDRLKGQVERQDLGAAERQVRVADEARAPLVAELGGIEAKIARIRAELLKEARILGVTSTKVFMSAKEIGQFDMVIIDEASMVTLPMLWFAAGLARERVVVCGDFRQIPPIVQTKQQAVYEAIGRDVFEAAGLTTLRHGNSRMVMLDTQHRMDPGICGLISGPMYRGDLKTATARGHTARGHPPDPFGGALTIVDTADLWPFESVNAFYSRFNLMHALLVRNLAWHFHKQGYIRNNTDLGICTPYAAQSKLVRKLLDDVGLKDLVPVGTVHSFQGDERNTILLEIPEGHGGSRMLGHFVQGVSPDQVGARLINVAVSRAENHLIILANLTYLDRLLPSSSLLRSILYEMQQKGRVIAGSEVLALRPIEHDLRGLIGQVELDLDAQRLGLFNQTTFEPAVTADMANAKDSIVIFSGFVTPRRVARLGDLLRSKIAQGVRVRCITRPPHLNGTMDVALGKEALDSLEGIGCVVDCRARIHEKVILIDKEIVWHGSLNALSHTHRTDESMTRLVNGGLAQAIAANMSKRHMSASRALSTVAEAENPRCEDCGARSVYDQSKYGPFFYCEGECGWRRSLKTMERDARSRSSTQDRQGLEKDGPPCPICKRKTMLRNGRFGVFYGCVDYPACKGTVKPNRNNTGKSTKDRKAKGSKGQRR